MKSVMKLKHFGLNAQDATLLIQAGLHTPKLIKAAGLETVTGIIGEENATALFVRLGQ